MDESSCGRGVPSLSISTSTSTPTPALAPAFDFLWVCVLTAHSSSEHPHRLEARLSRAEQNYSRARRASVSITTALLLGGSSSRTTTLSQGGCSSGTITLLRRFLPWNSHTPTSYTCLSTTSTLVQRALITDGETRRGRPTPFQSLSPQGVDNSAPRHR